MARNADDVPMTRMYPAPMRPTRRAWMAVVMPLIKRAVQTAHDRWASLPPARLTTMAGANTTPATEVMASWSPSPTVTGKGGRSSGS